jgi:integrase
MNGHDAWSSPRLTFVRPARTDVATTPVRASLRPRAEGLLVRSFALSLAARADGPALGGYSVGRVQRRFSRSTRYSADVGPSTARAILRPQRAHSRTSITRLSDRSVARIVQRTAKAAGLDPARYGGHSLRSGFMTTAAEKGRPLEAIMRQTGHKTERVARGYIQHATVFVNNPA